LHVPVPVLVALIGAVVAIVVAIYTQRKAADSLGKQIAHQTVIIEKQIVADRQAQLTAAAREAASRFLGDLQQFIAKGRDAARGSKIISEADIDALRWRLLDDLGSIQLLLPAAHGPSANAYDLAFQIVNTERTNAELLHTGVERQSTTALVAQYNEARNETLAKVRELLRIQD
jgi:hypothetical protein